MYKNIKKKKIIFLSSSQHFAEVFLNNFLKKISLDFHIELITNFNKNFKITKKIKLHNVEIQRKVSLLKDIKSLIRILFIIIKSKPDFVVTTTPKCTIYGVFIKLFFPRINRSHIYSGITWTNFKGLKRKIFIFIDRINIFFSDKVIFDGKEQIKYLNQNGIKNNKFHLIHFGSIKGVDPDIFYRRSLIERNRLRKKYNIPNNLIVILYMGRLDKDKGINKLVKVFEEITLDNNKLILLIVGKDEMSFIKEIKYNNLFINNKILYLPHQKSPELIFNLADIFCIPSSREGFGNVVIEAGASEVPVIGSNIYGLQSSLINNFNGLVFKLDDQKDFFLKLKEIVNNYSLRRKLGKNGREFAIMNFKPDDIFKSLKNLILS